MAHSHFTLLFQVILLESHTGLVWNKKTPAARVLHPERRSFSGGRRHGHTSHANILFGVNPRLPVMWLWLFPAAGRCWLDDPCKIYHNKGFLSSCCARRVFLEPGKNTSPPVFSTPGGES